MTNRVQSVWTLIHASLHPYCIYWGWGVHTPLTLAKGGARGTMHYPAHFFNLERQYPIIVNYHSKPPNRTLRQCFARTVFYRNVWCNGRIPTMTLGMPWVPPPTHQKYWLHPCNKIHYLLGFPRSDNIIVDRTRFDGIHKINNGQTG